MKRGSTLFLKLVILLIALMALVALFRFPQTEGRAANLDLINIYTDPFVIYIYVASTPFFAALFQTIKLLSYVDNNDIFSEAAVKTLRNIKYCAIAIIGFIVVAILYIRMIAHGDDAAGPTMIGLVATFTTTVIATATAVFQKLLENAVNIKSENDLTV